MPTCSVDKASSSGELEPESRVSILLPVFNASKYIAAALRSIENQTYKNYDVIVVDDGSEDDSSDAIRRFANDHPGTVVRTRENRGIVQTRNELLNLATGPYVAWMDADDVMAPNRLSAQVTKLNEDPELACVGSFAQCIDPEDNWLNVEAYPTNHSEIIDSQRSAGGIRFPTTMMRRRKALAVGGFREPFRIGEDLDFLMRLGEKDKLSNIPAVLYFYRQHLESTCARLGPVWSRNLKKIQELASERESLGYDALQAGRTIDIEPVSEWRQSKNDVASVYASWAGSALTNRNHRLAFRYSRASIIANPFHKSGWIALVRALGLVRSQKVSLQTSQHFDH